MIPDTAHADHKRLNDAMSDHIKANTAFNLKNSDETMQNLIGSWARTTRVMWEMEMKYEGKTK